MTLAVRPKKTIVQKASKHCRIIMLFCLLDTPISCPSVGISNMFFAITEFISLFLTLSHFVFFIFFVCEIIYYRLITKFIVCNTCKNRCLTSLFNRYFNSSRFFNIFDNASGISCQLVLHTVLFMLTVNRGSGEYQF